MPGRRRLQFLLALFACHLPACLHISARVGPEPITTPEKAAEIGAKAKSELVQPLPQTQSQQPPQRQFAVLPKVPGTSVPTNPGAPATAGANTSHKPTDAATVAPPNGVKPAGGEPSPFPLLAPAGLPEPPLLAAVRAHCEGKPEVAIEIIRRMDKNQQDFVLAVLPILARGASTDLANDPATVAALVEQMRGAVARLEPLAALRIEKIALCARVDGFGRFEPRPAANPYRPNERVTLYLELRNLGSQLSGDGYLIRAHGAGEIRDANDKLVAQIDSKDNRRVPVVKFEQEIATRSPLQDFHVLYNFSAPPVPGVYTVTVQLSDATGRRMVKSPPVEFRVAGP